MFSCLFKRGSYHCVINDSIQQLYMMGFHIYVSIPMHIVKRLYVHLIECILVIRCKSIVHIKIKSDIPLITWIYPTFYNWSKVLHKNNKILYLICRCGRMIRKLVVLLFCIRDCHAWRRRTMLVNVLLQKWAAFLRKLEIPSQINKCT